MFAYHICEGLVARFLLTVLLNNFIHDLAFVSKCCLEEEPPRTTNTNLGSNWNSTTLFWCWRQRALIVVRLDLHEGSHRWVRSLIWTLSTAHPVASCFFYDQICSWLLLALRRRLPDVMPCMKQGDQRCSIWQHIAAKRQLISAIRWVSCRRAKDGKDLSVQQLVVCNVCMHGCIRFMVGGAEAHCLCELSIPRSLAEDELTMLLHSSKNHRTPQTLHVYIQTDGLLIPASIDGPDIKQPGNSTAPHRNRSMPCVRSRINHEGRSCICCWHTQRSKKGSQSGSGDTERHSYQRRHR